MKIVNHFATALFCVTFPLVALGGGGLSTVSISKGGAASETGQDSFFTVTRVGGEMSNSLTVGISITGTAALGSDYTLSPAFVTAVSISANEASVNVVLEPLADNLLEGVEQAIITLTPNVAYDLGAMTSVTIDIADDPVEVNLTAPDTDASEAGPDNGSFTVTRTGGDGASTLTVGMSITGTAGLGLDYTLSPAFVTAVAVPGGSSSITVDLIPMADNLLEGAEEANITLTPNSSAYHLGSTIAETIHIADDPVEVSISSSDPLASEVTLDPASFTVSRSGGNTTASLTVGIAVSGSATFNGDYTFSPAFVTAVSISGNQPSVTVTVTPQVQAGDLPNDEGEETVVIDLQGTDYLIAAPGSTTLVIDDSDDSLFMDGFEQPELFKSCIRGLAKSDPDRFIDQGDTVFDLKTGLFWKSCGSLASFDWQTGLCQPDTVADLSSAADLENSGKSGRWREPTDAERLATGASCADGRVSAR